MAETWTVNGVDLRSLATRIEAGDGLKSTPELLSGDVQIPGRHGVLAADRQVHGPGQWVVNMWVKGVDPSTGLVPGGSSDVDEYHKRCDELTRLFVPASLVTVVHTWPNGTARKAVGRVASTLDFTREVSFPLFGRFSAAVRIHDAFWADVSPQSQTVSLANNATAALSSFATATAPMTGLTVTFGAGANPTITQVATGVFLAYDNVITAGRQLTIDCGNRVLGYGSGSAWDVSGEWPNIRFGGSVGSLFELRPESTSPTVRLTHTGGGSMSTTIAGPRAYLVG